MGGGVRQASGARTCWLAAFLPHPFPPAPKVVQPEELARRPGQDEDADELGDGNAREDGGAHGLHGHRDALLTAASGVGEGGGDVHAELDAEARGHGEVHDADGVDVHAPGPSAVGVRGGGVEQPHKADEVQDDAAGGGGKGGGMSGGAQGTEMSGSARGAPG